MKKNLYILLFLSIIILITTDSIAQQQVKKSTAEQLDKTFLKRQNAELFIEATKAKNLGDIKKAEEIFNDCLSLDPKDAASMYELARIYILNNELEKARLMAEKAITIDTTNNWYKLLLTNIYKLNKSYDKSIKILEQLVQQNPDNIEFLEELAYSYALNSESLKSIDILNVIERKIGVNEQIAIQKQKLFQNLKKPDSAIQEIENLINEFPYEIRYYALMAELSLQCKFDEKALWAYSKIVEIDPENAYIHISLSDFYRNSGDTINAHNELKLGFKNKQLDLESKIQILLSYYPAQQIFENKNKYALELIFLLSEVYPDNARILSIKSEVLYQSRKFEEAKEVLLKVISIDSSLVGSWEQLLITESALSDLTSLDDHAQKAIQLFPGRPIPYLFAGMVKSQNGEYQKALEYYEKGLPLIANNTALKVQFYSFLGDTYHELENTKKSDQSYENAIIFDPENSVVLNNYAYYLALRSEKLERAKQMSFKAVELDPENASNLDTKAWVLYKLKMFQESKLIIEKALDIDEDNTAEVYEHYGDILFQLGEIKKAVKQWKKARKKGSDSEFLLKKIKQKKLYE